MIAPVKKLKKIKKRLNSNILKVNLNHKKTAFLKVLPNFAFLNNDFKKIKNFQNKKIFQNRKKISTRNQKNSRGMQQKT